MQHLVIKRQTLSVSYFQAETYRKILNVLGISFEQVDQPEPKNIPITELLDQLNTRSRNIVYYMVHDYDIKTVNEFVEKCTVRDYLRYRNSGPKTLKYLKAVLEDLGYKW